MKIKYILPIIFAFLLAACFDDDTTTGTQPISVISIDTTKLEKVYNINKFETRIITPEITQTDSSLPLSYEWQVDYKFYSDSVAFRFTGKDLGSYEIRLKVSNQDGSTFYTFQLNVNSPYEEGIAMLSEGPQGQTELSFMRKYSDEELKAGIKEKFVMNCLQLNNPDVSFEKSPTDMAKRGTQLFICCQNHPIVYAVNTKTFELENAISAPEYPDFIPLKMNIPDNTSRISDVLCQHGVVYSLSTHEGVIVPHTYLTGKYAEQTFFCAPYQVYSYYWNPETCQILNNNGYNITTSEKALDGQELIQYFNGIYNDYITIISRDKTNGKIKKTNIGSTFIAYNDDYTERWFDLREEKILTGNTNLKPTSPSVASSVYNQLLYAEGNKIYRWYYSDNSFPTTPWTTINLENCEITYLGLSPDETQLYVGVYQPQESGLNGHLYILDSDTGKPVGDTPYLHVGYKPVKIMYKVK